MQDIVYQPMRVVVDGETGYGRGAVVVIWREELAALQAIEAPALRRRALVIHGSSMGQMRAGVTGCIRAWGGWWW